jgi:hypothetical protein
MNFQFTKPKTFDWKNFPSPQIGTMLCHYWMKTFIIILLKNNTDKECTTKFGIPHFRQKCLPRVVDTKMCQDDN